MSFAISSLQNKRLKELRLLMEKSKERRETGMFVIDGWKEILMAKDAGYYIRQLFIRDGSTYKKEIDEIWPEDRPDSVLVFRDIFDKLSYRGVTSGAIAIAESKEHNIQSIQLRPNPIILVIDAVEKPGNLGAIIRTADATNIDAVICCDTATDIYNANIIRSSVGCIFSVPIAVASRENAIQWLKDNNIQIFTTSLKASLPYTQLNYNQATAFVLGTEASGVNPIWEESSNQNIILPMLGKNDSLNVSNTAAVLLYEALRQRSQ
ncbi:MAG: RNA methyltransferase [Chitinophagales bacterium]|nr:RNA methyltransferase [Chitinophagales bacterium]